MYSSTDLVLTLFKISISESSSYNKYKYFNVSAKKKLSILFFGCVLGTLTSAYSPYAIFVLQYFSMDWKISLFEITNKVAKKVSRIE